MGTTVSVKKNRMLAS